MQPSKYSSTEEEEEKYVNITNVNAEFMKNEYCC